MDYGFSDSELLVSTADGLHFTLKRAFTYRRKDGELITVPLETTSDGASTPRFLWRVFPPFGKYWKGAFLHDYLYRDSKRPKEFCDETFLEAMEFLNVEDVEAHTMYEGVHLLGWHSFQEDREEQNKEAKL